MSEYMSNRMVDSMSEDMSDRLPDQMSDGRSAYFLEILGIYATVGNYRTRTKAETSIQQDKFEDSKVECDMEKMVYQISNLDSICADSCMNEY